jgi:hypothetical protein
MVAKACANHKYGRRTAKNGGERLPLEAARGYHRHGDTGGIVLQRCAPEI